MVNLVVSIVIVVRPLHVSLVDSATWATRAKIALYEDIAKGGSSAREGERWTPTLWQKQDDDCELCAQDTQQVDPVDSVLEALLSPASSWRDALFPRDGKAQTFLPARTEKKE